jgi:hypothetical protein
MNWLLKLQIAGFFGYMFYYLYSELKKAEKRLMLGVERERPQEMIEFRSRKVRNLKMGLIGEAVAFFISLLVLKKF